jgi:purine-cytosine permease-like protein
MTMTATGQEPLAAPPKITEVEVHGVEPIPDAERTARPLDLFRLVFGGANTIATVVLGSFPIIFGLSFRDALLATLAGLVLGATILAPMALFGPRNGTNNAVSSSAHLGVHGRVIGSFLSLLTAVAFFSISVWSSGDVLVGGANRAIGLPNNDFSVAVAYGIFALMVLVVCIYGFRFMLLVNKIAVIAATVLFLLGIFAFAGTFDPGYAGIFGPQADAATNALYWPSFVGAALIVMSNPVSFGAFLGDWARYIPRETPAWKSMSAAFLAQIATLVPFLFGLVTATVVATNASSFMDDGNYVGGLLAVSPGWYFVPVCLIALIGGMSTGTTALYGTGLDSSSPAPHRGWSS